MVSLSNLANRAMAHILKRVKNSMTENYYPSKDELITLGIA
jgi:hypothetical protein